MTPGKTIILLAILYAVTVAQAQPTASLEVALSSKGKPLEDGVITLTPLDFTPPALTGEKVEIAQVSKQYDPYVTVLRVGTRALFPNRDNVQHHLYSVSKPKRFEKPLYASGKSETVVFDKPGVVTLGCNIHDWMIAYIFVVETPWHQKSGPDGLASLTDLPAGRYILEVWHPRIRKPIRQEIMLTEGARASEQVSLKLKRDRRIRRAPVGRSGGY